MDRSLKPTEEITNTWPVASIEDFTVGRIVFYKYSYQKWAVVGITSIANLADKYGFWLGMLLACEDSSYNMEDKGPWHGTAQKIAEKRYRLVPDNVIRDQPEYKWLEYNFIERYK